MKAIIKSVVPYSIAEEAGIEKGDVLLTISGQELFDILDYKFLCANGEYDIEIEKINGDIEIIEIINDDYEDLGIEFENGLIDKPQVCKNKCVFCFVDQLPKGMRKTLYFKDDDYRLSTLMGNYITLTNLADADVQRIIDMHLPRINVSVHATDAELRGNLLNSKNADILKIIRRFAKAGINMNCQIVLCKGINDGENLDKTITDLAKFYPQVQSISVVPVGLTKHRGGLPYLERFDKISSEFVVSQIESHQSILLKTLKTRFAFAADEFYVYANHKLPGYECYEDFLQIENGVGLLSSLECEFKLALIENNNRTVRTKKTIATGVSAAPYIQELVDKVDSNIKVIPITNEFFGDSITVAGLITGQDIIKQLSGKELGQQLLIPSTMLNFDEIFLDDLTIQDVEKALKVKIITVENDGFELLEKLLK